MICVNCGLQLKDGAKFCLRCGTPIGAASPTGTTQREEGLAKLNNLKVGDTFFFGFHNGKQISWKVLRIQDRMALVITTDNVCDMRYHQFEGDITWGECTLRRWLNNDFLNGDFTQAERARILPCKLRNDGNPKFNVFGGAPTTDMVFLLSIYEAKDFYADDQARANGSYWWLRTPGSTNKDACLVLDNGMVGGGGVSCQEPNGVRPVLWLNLTGTTQAETINLEGMMRTFNARNSAESIAKLKYLKAGDTFFYGSHNGQRISWNVLIIQDRKALVITTDIVCKMPYHQFKGNITWSECTLRKWLNNDFINGNFTQAEREKILSSKLNNNNNPESNTPGGSPTTDRVFLLTIYGARTLFADNQARSIILSSWWLRSPGDYPDYAARVTLGGQVDTYGSPVLNDCIGVRPALWLDLNS